MKLGDTNDHEGARLKFNQAWALLKSPTILFNLARAERMSNHFVESVEHYRQFAKWPADPKVNDQQRDRAKEAIAELAVKVAQLRAPNGTRIVVDGKPHDITDEPLAVEPGKHSVEIAGSTVEVDCPIGTMCPVEAPKKDTAAAPPPTTTAPPPQTSAPPAAADGGPGFWTAGRAAGLGIAVVGLGGVALGVVFHSAASDSNDEVEGLRKQLTSESQCNRQDAPVFCADLQSKIDERSTNETLRASFLIAGGAFVVGGVLLFLLSSPAQRPSTSTKLTPMVSPTSAGLAWSGRF